MEILSHPSPALHAGTEDLDPLEDKSLVELIKAMAQTMYDAPGVGLAAPQIGVLKRVIVYDIEEGGGDLHALCNPRIVERSEESVIEDEGCLSLPGITIPIERSAAVTCEAEDIGGNPVRVEASEMLARVLQHEIDHLDGVLIIDRASPEEKKAALRRYAELSASVR